MLVKLPPTKILPSACTAIEETAKRGVRVESHIERAVRVQSGNVVARHAQNAGKVAADENLAIRLHGGGDKHSADGDRLRLSVWSSLPSVSSRAMRLRITAAPRSAQAVVKLPPAKILPSAWTAIERTKLLRWFGSKESARPVVASSRAMRLRVWPPMLFVKKPPAKILPSACTAIEKTIVCAVRVRVEGICQAGRGIEPGDASARLVRRCC